MDAERMKQYSMETLEELAMGGDAAAAQELRRRYEAGSPAAAAQPAAAGPAAPAVPSAAPAPDAAPAQKLETWYADFRATQYRRHSLIELDTAAQAGDPFAAYALAAKYMQSKNAGEQQRGLDYLALARALLADAMMNNVSPAVVKPFLVQVLLTQGRYYENTEQPEKAFLCYQDAHETDPRQTKELVRCLEQGVGTARDPERAAALREQAARHGGTAERFDMALYTLRRGELLTTAQWLQQALDTADIGQHPVQRAAARYLLCRLGEGDENGSEIDLAAAEQELEAYADTPAYAAVTAEYPTTRQRQEEEARRAAEQAAAEEAARKAAEKAAEQAAAEEAARQAAEEAARQAAEKAAAEKAAREAAEKTAAEEAARRAVAEEAARKAREKAAAEEAARKAAEKATARDAARKAAAEKAAADARREEEERQARAAAAAEAEQKQKADRKIKLMLAAGALVLLVLFVLLVVVPRLGKPRDDAGDAAVNDGAGRTTVSDAGDDTPAYDSGAWFAGSGDTSDAAPDAAADPDTAPDADAGTASIYRLDPAAVSLNDALRVHNARPEARVFADGAEVAFADLGGDIAIPLSELKDICQVRIVAPDGAGYLTAAVWYNKDYGKELSFAADYGDYTACDAEGFAQPSAKVVDVLTWAFHDSFLRCINDGTTSELRYSTQNNVQLQATYIFSDGNTRYNYDLGNFHAGCDPDSITMQSDGTVLYNAAFTSYGTDKATGEVKTISNHKTIELVWEERMWKVNRIAFLSDDDFANRRYADLP